MRFDFDPGKDAANRLKHGVPLLFGARVFGDPGAVIVPTVRIGDEEERYKAIGLVDGRLWTVIHVWRDEVVRLISVRRSNAREQRDHDRYSRRS
jgi:uncharacterized DUF497 family protein